MYPLPRKGIVFLRIIFFVLCLRPFFLMGVSLSQNTQNSTGAAPSWVKSYDFSLGEIEVKPSQVNLQYLLIDTQRNWEEQILYCHYVVKTLTKRGVEHISQLAIDFDPSYTQLVMHSIRIFREGKWLDRLEKTRCNLIQRETDLERNLYNGDLTLVYFLEDIREGDIVEYSYSLKGAHPLFSSHYTDKVYMQRDFSVEKIAHRTLADPKFSFLIKPTHTAIEPKICDLSPSLREWCWESSDTPPYSYEENQPVWHNPPIYIEMSQYLTWEEVVKKFYPFYVLPSDFSDSIPLEMGELIEKWKISTPDATKRALLALRFVQDQIRYLGIEEGMRAFKPTDPCLTFQRRFGDCKDKTFLLHALLQLMEIPSSPLLVHTGLGKRLLEALPAPSIFDHIVLQIEIDGTAYYVDPTYNLQGGSLQTNFFPDYGWGLILSKDSKDLISLPKVVFKNPTEIDTSFILETEDIAHLKIKSVFHGSQADQWRGVLEWYGLKKIEEGFLTKMQEIYGGASLDAPIQIVDNREKNITILTESYRVPTETLSDRKSIKIFSYILRDYVDGQINPERASPYQLSYPMWVKERIHVDNPFGRWDRFEQDYKTDHESLLYSLSTRIEKNRASFDLELKHLQDHVPKHSLQDYWCMIHEIARESPYDLLIVPLASSVGGFDFRVISLAVVLVVIAIFGLVYLVMTTRKAKMRQEDTEWTKVRRNWLNSWKAFVGYHGLMILWLGGLRYFVGSESKDSEALLMGIAFSCRTIFWLTLCFFCAYRKTGTKLLTVFLVFSIVHLFNDILSFAKEANISQLVDFAVIFPFFIWFQIASWDLRRQNLQIKHLQPHIPKSDLIKKI